MCRYRLIKTNGNHQIKNVSIFDDVLSKIDVQILHFESSSTFLPLELENDLN